MEILSLLLICKPLAVSGPLTSAFCNVPFLYAEVLASQFSDSPVCPQSVSVPYLGHMQWHMQHYCCLLLSMFYIYVKLCS